jgi:hypothetical protein
VVVLLGGREGLGRQVARRCHLVVTVSPDDAWDEVMLGQWRRVVEVLEARRRASAGPGEPAGGRR